MNQEVRIEILKEKKLLGQHLRMSFTNNMTKELWQGFMPRRKEIINNIGQELYSLEVYELNYFKDFNPEKVFEKWAAVEVEDYDKIPDGIESFTIEEGLYAVFIHKGTASEGQKTYQYIFNNWLPASEYELDNRPHFAVMGDKYKHESPDSEEEIWIPIRQKE